MSKTKLITGINLMQLVRSGYKGMKVDTTEIAGLLKTIRILDDYDKKMGGTCVFDQESLGYRVTDKTNGTSFFRGTRTHIALTEISRRLLAYKMDQEFPEAVEEKPKRGRL